MPDLDGRIRLIRFGDGTLRKFPNLLTRPGDLTKAREGLLLLAATRPASDHPRAAHHGGRK